MLRGGYGGAVARFRRKRGCAWEEHELSMCWNGVLFMSFVIKKMHKLELIRLCTCVYSYSPENMRNREGV